jgi:hypothetical protein
MREWPFLDRHQLFLVLRRQIMLRRSASECDAQRAHGRAKIDRDI